MKMLHVKVSLCQRASVCECDLIKGALQSKTHYILKNSSDWVLTLLVEILCRSLFLHVCVSVCADVCVCFNIYLRERRRQIIVDLLCFHLCRQS